GDDDGVAARVLVCLGLIDGKRVTPECGTVRERARADLAEDTRRDADVGKCYGAAESAAGQPDVARFAPEERDRPRRFDERTCRRARAAVEAARHIDGQDRLA